MAPRASTSRAQRSASPSDDDGGPRQRNGKGKGKGEGRTAADEEHDENDNAAQLAALDLKDPLKTCRHLFLQALVARKVVHLDTAKALYQECVKLCRRALVSLSL